MTNTFKITIELFDSTALLGLLQKHKIDEDVFDLEERRFLREIHEFLIKREESIKEVLSKPIETDYSNSLFISKLNSANITEHHHSYERQFFNAEMLEKTINSKGISKDIKELTSLKLNIHDLWLTQYTKNANENDGSELLGKVNERIEDLSETNLKTAIDISVTEKKGMLHQFADKCEIGWVKNYKEKLIKFNKDKDGN